MAFRFSFDFQKALQAAAYLLRRERSRQMNYMRLIKLLYIAERESLRETGRPISGGRVIAMQRGPVLEAVLHLIRGEHMNTPEWAKHFRRDNYNLELIADPGVGKLSKYVMEKLEEVARRHEGDDEWDMVNICHQFPEWARNDPGTSSRPIPTQDILAALGLDDTAQEIMADARRTERVSRFFDASPRRTERSVRVRTTPVPRVAKSHRKASR